VFILKIDICIIKNIGLQLEMFLGVRAIKHFHKMLQNAERIHKPSSEKLADHGQEETQGAS
jgi:hypothetical protein